MYFMNRSIFCPTVTSSGTQTLLIPVSSENALRTLIGSQPVRCEGDKKDKYNRVLAVCYAGNINLNAEIVRQGWALAYRRYSKDYVSVEMEDQFQPHQRCPLLGGKAGIQAVSFSLNYSPVEPHTASATAIKRSSCSVAPLKVTFPLLVNCASKSCNSAFRASA